MAWFGAAANVLHERFPAPSKRSTAVRYCVGVPGNVYRASAVVVPLEPGRRAPTATLKADGSTRALLHPLLPVALRICSTVNDAGPLVERKTITFPCASRKVVVTGSSGARLCVHRDWPSG